MNHERSASGERLWALVYGSASVGTIEEETLRSILRTSREYNARLGVTGALFYRNGNFLQVWDDLRASEYGAVTRIWCSWRALP